jgi:Tol biopolymer transport system component
MKVDGSAERRLTWTEGMEGMPIWSPDGIRLMVLTSINDGPFTVLDIIKADGTEWRRLIGQSAFFRNALFWSPDGTHIFYEIQTGNGDGQFSMMDADGNNNGILIEGAWSNFQPQP